MENLLINFRVSLSLLSQMSPSFFPGQQEPLQREGQIGEGRMVSETVPSWEAPGFSTPQPPAKRAQGGGATAQRGVRFVNLLSLPMNKPRGLPSFTAKIKMDLYSLTKFSQ